MHADTLITSFRTQLLNSPLKLPDNVNVFDDPVIGVTLFLLVAAGFIFGIMAGWVLWKK